MPDLGSSSSSRHGHINDQSGALLSHRGAGRPFFPRREWKKLPCWVLQTAERGSVRLCGDGHRLRWQPVTNRLFAGAVIDGQPECNECEAPLPRRSQALFCRRCFDEEDSLYLVCGACNGRPRLPALWHDALFHGPRLPAALLPPSFELPGPGTVIVVPGGNYEFLASHEAWPVVRWLEGMGIAALVLRYRTLPAFGLEEALDDLEAAAEVARRRRPGPVAAVGFSAGGHLVAALAARAAARGLAQPLDAAVLAYPSINPRPWADPYESGFTRAANGDIVEDEDALCMHKRAASLQGWTDNLLGAGDAPFGAPPTFLVASTTDTIAPSAEHTDPYRRLLAREKVPHVYVHRDLSEHGFGLSGGWTDRCATWLARRGFGEQQPARKRRREPPAG